MPDGAGTGRADGPGPGCAGTDGAGGAGTDGAGCAGTGCAGRAPGTGGRGLGRAIRLSRPATDSRSALVRPGGGGVRGLDLGVDLGAVHLDAARRLDPQPDGVAADVEHDDPDLVPDDDALAGTTGQHQHSRAPSVDPSPLPVPRCGGR